MELTKEEALVLVKFIHMYDNSDPHPQTTQPFMSKVSYLRRRAEAFLMEGDVGEDVPEHDDAEDELDDAEEVTADDTLTKRELARLKPITSSQGRIIFINGVTGEIDLWVDGHAVVHDVCYVQRLGKELRVMGSIHDGWHTYEVPKFSPDWTNTLRLKDVVEVWG